MQIIGAIFNDEDDLAPALDALRDAGFETYKLFGADDFSGDPGVEDSVETDSTRQKHTAAGTVSGISVNPPADIPEETSTETIRDELMALGLSQDDAEIFVTALQQDRLLLLVQTWTGRTDEADELLQQHNARMTRRIHPGDAFPEDIWR